MSFHGELLISYHFHKSILIKSVACRLSFDFQMGPSLERKIISEQYLHIFGDVSSLIEDFVFLRRDPVPSLGLRN